MPDAGLMVCICALVQWTRLRDCEGDLLALLFTDSYVICELVLGTAF